jgi:putative Ca2+/H+ antiporter (TMEM165/GDT1 family)
MFSSLLFYRARSTSPDRHAHDDTLHQEQLREKMRVALNEEESMLFGRNVVMIFYLLLGDRSQLCNLFYCHPKSV